MWTALDIFIGLALCYALISLFCTAIQEFIAQMLDLRGKLLVRALKSIDFPALVEKLGTNFLANPAWVASTLLPTSPTSQAKSLEEQKARSASANGWGSKNWARLTNFVLGRRLMADPTAENLAMTISSGMKLIVNGKAAIADDTTIDALPVPEGLKARLRALSTTARDDVDKVKVEVEKWCGDFLAEVNHWFTRRAQVVSLIIGFAVALALNVDTIEIATKLNNDPVLRDAAVKAAGKLVADDKLKDCPAPAKPIKTEPSTDVNKTQDTKDAEAKLSNVKNCLASIQTTYPIPLGWDGVPTVKKELESKDGDSFGKARKVICAVFAAIDLTKLIGLLLTAIALSLGSRFWFDTLKNLLALRTGGQPKAETK